MSTQDTTGFITLEIDYRPTGDNSAWGLEHYYTYKPDRLLPLIEGYEVHEGSLVKQPKEIYSHNKSDLVGEVVFNNMTNNTEGEN
jgi:hypothetical protein